MWTAMAFLFQGQGTETLEGTAVCYVDDGVNTLPFRK